jgi:hypothetical protein
VRSKSYIYIIAQCFPPCVCRRDSLPTRKLVKHCVVLFFELHVRCGNNNTACAVGTTTTHIGISRGSSSLGRNGRHTIRLFVVVIRRLRNDGRCCCCGIMMLVVVTFFRCDRRPRGLVVVVSILFLLIATTTTTAAPRCFLFCNNNSGRPHRTPQTHHHRRDRCTV